MRTQLRQAMNGVISTSMREKCIVYKLNFGVPLP
ncbi:DNA alkylation repair protein, partial [Parabacteroides merdae]|nr:DNA alkylation repair protein [Parabacteroides merdae]